MPRTRFRFIEWYTRDCDMLLTKIQSYDAQRTQIRFTEWYTRNVSLTKVRSYDARRAPRTHIISFYRMVYARRVVHKSTEL